MSNNLPSTLPTEIAAALEKHRLQIQQTAGDSLLCMVLYGGASRGRYKPGVSDINVLLVLKDATGETLTRLAPVLTSAWREIRLEPFILAASELSRAAAVFPTKMLDIKNNHKLLCGKDLLSELAIKPEDLRFRIEQELSNLTLRLRRRFLSISADDQAMQRTLLEAAIPLRIALLALLQDAGSDVQAEERTIEVYSQAATKFGLDASALERLAKLRETGEMTGEARGLYLAVLQVASRAAELAKPKPGAA